MCDERFRVALSSAVAVLDRVRGEAIYHTADAQRLPYWELAHPARLVFSAWSETAQLGMCHAAAVGDGDVGLLVVGSGGAGKSTVALTCLNAGLRCAGDDYVLLETTSGPIAHSLYTSTLLRPTTRNATPR